jgi:hypothetical protein
MPARNDPVLDSGFPQVDLPGRPRRWFRSAFVWFLPLLLGVSLLLSWKSEDEDVVQHIWTAFGVIAFAIVSMAIWWWRTRSLSCPRCRQRLFRAGADSDCTYYPCSRCRVMWRSSTERLPKVDDLDFS